MDQQPKISKMYERQKIKDYIQSYMTVCGSSRINQKLYYEFLNKHAKQQLFKQFSE